LDLAVGLDVGGTWARVALGDGAGNILKRAARPVVTRCNDDFIDQLASMAIDVCDGDLSRVKGIGIAMAGRLNIMEGTLAYSPHTSLRDVRICAALRERLHVEVVMLNDNLAAAYAERSAGAGRNHRNLVFVGIGTGIGGGAIVDGRLLIGKEGNAHEIGHMIIDMEGRLGCPCGGRGHWEAYTSGSGLPNFARLLADEHGGPWRSTLFCGKSAASPGAKEILEAARAGDKFAESVVEEAAKVNSMALANLTDLYDPSLIVMGGGVAMKNKDLIVERASALLKNYSFNTAPTVVAAAFGEDAPLRGALLSVFRPPFLD
jgi:glucokinase